MNIMLTIDSFARGFKFKCLGNGSSPTITTATKAFPSSSIPKGTKFVAITVFTASVSFTFSDSDTPSATNGIQVPVGTSWFAWDEDMLRDMMAFSSTGTYNVHYFSFSNRTQ